MERKVVECEILEIVQIMQIVYTHNTDKDLQN
jgi:hypothetical protein